MSNWNSEPAPVLGEGEDEALEAAIHDQVDGIIIFPSRPQTLRPAIRRASRANIPVVCVATDAPQSGRLGMVAIDTLASGSIAADLMGRFLNGKAGSVARHRVRHGRSRSTRKNTRPLNPPCTISILDLQTLKPIEDHDLEKEAYRKCRKLFEERAGPRRDLCDHGSSIPVLKAAEDAKPARIG